MCKLLVLGEGQLDLSFLNQNYEYINLRGRSNVENLMDLYESIEPYRIKELREQIERINPDEIVVVGELEGYRWLATIVCRCFGQFNSWLGQYENKYGKTILKINNEDVKLLAIDKLDEWRYIDEIRT